MTLQEAIIKLIDLRHDVPAWAIYHEAFDTIIHAYCVTDEEIEKKAEEYSECEDANRIRYIDGDQFDAYVQGAKDFRDGKISVTKR